MFLRQKCFIDTGCVCTSSVASKKSLYQTIGKIFFWKKGLSVSDVHQCIVVIAQYCICSVLGDQGSMHPYEAGWTQTGGCYGKARLKEVLHAPPCTNIGQHRWSCVMICSTQLWETHCSVTINPEGCIVVHCNLRVETFLGYIFILTTIMIVRT